MAARERKRSRLSTSAPITSPPQMPTSTTTSQPFKPLTPQTQTVNPPPLPEGNRLQALSILGDILRKVGVSKLEPEPMILQFSSYSQLRLIRQIQLYQYTMHTNILFIVCLFVCLFIVSGVSLGFLQDEFVERYSETVRDLPVLLQSQSKYNNTLVEIQWCSRNSKSHFARNLLASRRTCY